MYEYNAQRSHQALDYVTPASVHFGYVNELWCRRQQNHELAQAHRTAESRKHNLSVA